MHCTRVSLRSSGRLRNSRQPRYRCDHPLSSRRRARKQCERCRIAELGNTLSFIYHAYVPRLLSLSLWTRNVVAWIDFFASKCTWLQAQSQSRSQKFNNQSSFTCIAPSYCPALYRASASNAASRGSAGLNICRMGRAGKRLPSAISARYLASASTAALRGLAGITNCCIAGAG